MDYQENDRARAERATDGFIKIMTLKGGKVLGATIVATGTYPDMGLGDCPENQDRSYRFLDRGLPDAWRNRQTGRRVILHGQVIQPAYAQNRPLPHLLRVSCAPQVMLADIYLSTDIHSRWVARTASQQRVSLASVALRALSFISE